jgi:hypothetical protein
MTTHLVYGDVHAHPGFNNDRATWLSKLIQDVNPDVVVNIGDGADLASLSSFDKGLKHFYGRNYKDDINAHLDFEDKVWNPIRKRKKKLPRRVYCVGNHDYRIERALAKSPELSGTMSMRDLELDRYYDDVVNYEGYGTPGIIDIDNIGYAHYVIAGVTGKALSSMHLGYQLIQKRHKSTTVGHQHIFSYDSQSVGKDKHIHGLCLPCMTDYPVDWAGLVEQLWNRGVVIKRNVEDGNYDLQVISLNTLKKEYGSG